MATLLERLYVEITADTEKMQKELLSASRRVQSFGKELREVGRGLTLGLTVPLAGVSVAAIKMASDAEEAANKFDVVFGSAAGRARQELERLTETVPLTVSQMQELSAGVQDLLVPMGLARESAADLSVSAVELAGDLGSFNNVGAAQVLDDIRSALIGSSEPISKYGVDTREAALQARALAEGLIEEGQALDRTTRALAVFAQIQAQSTDAIGDAARTVDSTANSFKFLARDVKQLAIDIGQILIPVVQPLVRIAVDIVGAISSWSTEVKTLAVVLGALAAAVGPVVLIAGSLVSAFGALLPVVTALGGVLVPGGALLVGIGLVAAAFLSVSERARSARQSLEEFRESLRGLSAQQLADELATVNRELFVISATLRAQGGLESASEAVVTRFRELQARAQAIGEETKRASEAMRQQEEQARAAAAAAQAAAEAAAAKAAAEAEAERLAEEEARRREEALEFVRETLELVRRVNATQNETVVAIRAQGAELRKNAAEQGRFAAIAAEFESTLDGISEGFQRLAEQDAALLQDAFVQVARAIGDEFGRLGRSINAIITEAVSFKGTPDGVKIDFNPAEFVSGSLAALGSFGVESFTAALVDLFLAGDKAAERARRITENVAGFDAAFEQFATAFDVIPSFVAQLRRNAELAEKQFQDLNADFFNFTRGNLPSLEEVEGAIAALEGQSGAAAKEALEFWTRVRNIIQAANANAQQILDAATKSLSQELELRRLRVLGFDEQAALYRLRIQLEDDLAIAIASKNQALVEAAYEVYNLERAAIEAAAAERRLADARRAAAFGANLAADVLAARGDDRGAFIAGQQIKRDTTIAEGRKLFEEGLISEAAFTRIVAFANEIFGAAVDAFDREAKRAAEAMREMARAAEFQAQQDLRNLSVRLLVAQGLDDEAFAMRQQIELLQAIEDGRSAEYIALLRQVQAAERAARSRDEEAKAARETEAAINGVTRALNAPNGLRLSLLRFQALGAGMPGVQQMPPGRFIGGQSADTSGPSISVAGGINVFSSGPEESGDELLAKIEQAVVRRVRSGGADPFRRRVS